MWTNEHITADGTVSEFAEPLLRPAIESVANRTTVPRENPPIALFGIRFDNLTVDQAIKRIDEMIAYGSPHYVVTANVDFCVQAMEDVELRRILFDAHLVLCDGTPLVWASRLFGNPLPERVAGADLVPLLLQHAARTGYRIFFLGGAPQVAQQAVARLQGEHPNLVVAGRYSPPFRPLLDMNHEEICQRIRAAKPDVLLVSLGCPKAEKWMAMHYRSLRVPVCIGVGATIDFLARHIRRAPGWMQHCGLEWLFRLAQEPRRLAARYARDLRAIGAPLISQLWAQRLSAARPRRSSPAAITISESTWARVRAPERFDYASVVRDADVWRQIATQHCLLDVSAVEFFDSSALALLMQLHHRLQPFRLILIAPSATVRRILHRFKLDDFFTVASDTIHARELVTDDPPPPAPPEFAHPVPPLLWKGELTAANAEDVWAATQPQIDALCNSGSDAIIDLAALRFIDSTGVGLMIRAKRYTQNLGATLRFRNPHPNVRNVLRMARLELFLLFP
ncbi:MAG: WecB/TagA/CpsF family glycosyltransferase [Verrucomicrobia subdivision 3 bacterium]|nr:WecB/TagA/CpsF family glycosyltransferase [Limisphaerales bacterium]